MKKLAIDLLLFAALGLAVLLLMLPAAHGESCATTYGARTRSVVVSEHAIVYPPTVAVVAQPVAVVVPQYSAQYAGLPPEVLLLLQQMGARLDSIDRQLSAPQVLQPGYSPVQPNPPVTQLTPAPAAPAMPAAVDPPVSASPAMPKLFARSCVNCHDSAVAKAKGNSIVLFSNRAEVPLDCKLQAKLLRAVERGAMPKGDKATDDEVDEVFDHYSK
jgi:mono/diheme cytochrome c family protein